MTGELGENQRRWRNRHIVRWRRVEAAEYVDERAPAAAAVIVVESEPFDGYQDTEHIGVASLGETEPPGFLLTKPLDGARHAFVNAGGQGIGWP